jgi:trehalose/maltose hydrolase-like predicted phosphorylase
MNMKKCVVTNPKTGETKAFTTNREAAKYFEVTVESVIRWKKLPKSELQVTVDSEKVTVDSEKFTVDEEKFTVDEKKFTIDSENLTVDSEKVTVEPRQSSKQVTVPSLTSFCMNTPQETLDHIHPADWKLHCPRRELCEATKTYKTWQCNPEYAYALPPRIRERRTS